MIEDRNLNREEESDITTPSLEMTFTALKSKLFTSPDNHYEFEGHFETGLSEYRLSVHCEVFGAFISEEGFIEVHARILKAEGLPKEQDDELIDKIHETIIDMLHGGDIDMNPDDMVLVPHIEKGAIIFDGNDRLNRMEQQILDLFNENKMSPKDIADLLDRMLDRMISLMASKVSNDENALEEIIGNQFNRRTARNHNEEISYIR